MFIYPQYKLAIAVVIRNVYKLVSPCIIAMCVILDHIYISQCVWGNRQLSLYIVHISMSIWLECEVGCFGHKTFSGGSFTGGSFTDGSFTDVSVTDVTFTDVSFGWLH